MSENSETSDDRALLPFDDGSGDGSVSRLVRRQWHDGRWFFSVVDVIAVLTDSDAPGTYWGMMKQRLAKDEGFVEVFTKCEKLKLRSPLDGKKYPTDAADVETMLRIIQSVPSPKAEPVRQWLAKVGAQRLEEYAAELPEDQQRLLLRGEVAEKNSLLAETVTVAGIVSRRDFATFQDYGYMGLYNGERARDIAARKGLPRGEHILDHMGSTELAANWFRITQTRDKIQRDGIRTKPEANAAHYRTGQVVRRAIAELDGVMPEDLPTPTRSIQQVERAERARLNGEARARRQLSLFGEGESDSDANA